MLANLASYYTPKAPTGNALQSVVDLASLKGGLVLVPEPGLLGNQVTWQDASGTVAANSDSDVLGKVADLANSHDADQSTSAAKPLLKTDGTLWRALYDGVDDSSGTSNYQSPGEDQTIVLGMELLTKSTSGLFLATYTNGVGLNLSNGVVRGTLKTSAGSDLLIGPDVSTTGKSVITVRWYRSTGVFEIYLDGVLANSATRTPSDLVVPPGFVILDGTHASLFGLVGISGTLTSSEVSDIQNLIADRMGVTL